MNSTVNTAAQQSIYQDNKEELLRIMTQIRNLQIHGADQSALRPLYQQIADRFAIQTDDGPRYSSQTTFTYIVRKHYQAMVDNGLVDPRRLPLDEVINETFAALMDGSLLARDLPKLREELATAEETGNRKRVEELQKDIEKSISKAQESSPINRLAQFVSYNGTKPGDARISTLIGGSTISDNGNRRLLQYRVSTAAEADRILAVYKVFGVHGWVMRPGEDRWLVRVEKADAERAYIHGTQELTDLMARGIEVIGPVFDSSGKKKAGGHYMLADSTTVVAEDGTEYDLADTYAALNTAYQPTPDDMLIGTGEPDVDALCKALTDEVLERIGSYGYSSSEYMMYCFDSMRQTAGAVATKYADAAEVNAMLRRCHKTLIRDVLEDLELDDLLSDRVRARLLEALATKASAMRLITAALGYRYEKLLKKL